MSRALMTALLLLAACGKKGGAGEYLEKAKAYTENVCKCTNADCVTKANAAFAEEMLEWTKKNAGKPTDQRSMSDADKKAIEDNEKKRAECSSRAMAAKTDAPKTATPAEGEPKKAPEGEPKKAPADGEPGKDPAGNASATDEPEAAKKVMEVQVKAGDVMAANEKDCKKMGEELTKLVADSKATLDAFDAWDKKDPAGKKAWQAKHQPDIEAWAKKTDAPYKACKDNKDVSDAWKALTR